MAKPKKMAKSNSPTAPSTGKRPSFIDPDDFLRMQKSYEQDDSRREDIIKQSRDVLKASKQASYAVHRSDLPAARALLDIAKKTLASMKSLSTKTQLLEDVGAYNEAEQEYTEGFAFYLLVTEKRIPRQSEAGVSTENYLCGLSDLTGECARRAVVVAIDRDCTQVEMLRSLTEEIFSQFLAFNFRNSELRKKSDSIKWNLKKIEEVLYDLSMKTK